MPKKILPKPEGIREDIVWQDASQTKPDHEGTVLIQVVTGKGKQNTWVMEAWWYDGIWGYGIDDCYEPEWVPYWAEMPNGPAKIKK